MAVSLNDILAVLRPLPDGPNVYLGPQPDDGAARTRVYGGQVAAQSALAAARHRRRPAVAQSARGVPAARESADPAAL
ncbi:hypothetical protein [Mycolicibacterium insubricum]|uniref:hypothetical protein n=1 Tax=Mycolicibacterium insubricum TaxID=444597 RepID=UPI0021F2FD40|nr:hypothetical protein [Mycolicibacterium insubricum]MCV7083924.1 hypothetical protein [Mycolicibacterium insubricum]